MASLIGQTTPPGGWTDTTGSSDSVEYILSTGMAFAVDGTINGVWWFVPSTLPTNAQFAIGVVKCNSGVNSSPTIVASEAKTKPVSGDVGTWKLFTFTTPVSVTAGDKFLICLRTNRYPLVSGFFLSAHTNGDISAWADNAPSFPNGCFDDSGLGTDVGSIPTQSFDQSFYGIDVDFTASGGGGTDATATPSLVAGTTTIGTPTVKTGSTASPSTVTGSVSIGTPTVSTNNSATATPSTVTGAVTIGTPTIGTGSSATATPATVHGAVSIPTPTVVVPVNATATPTTVMAVASIPSPFVIAGAQWSVWDGLHEIQLVLDGEWNGTSIDALSFSEVIA
jgi:hypothetical protein